MKIFFLKNNGFQKLLLLLLFLCAILGVFAQKLARASFEEINKSIVFPPLIKQLTKEDKFAFIYPSHLSYYGGTDVIINEIFGVSTSFGVKARYNSSKADYYFEIQMNGMENIIPKAPRWQGSNSGGPKGFVKDITYNFPCSLIVKDRDGKTLKKLAIYGRDQEFSAVYHTGFFTGVYDPFGAGASADTAYERNHYQINKKIEAQIAAAAYGQICQALVYFFAEYNTSRLSYDIAGVKTKNREFDYSSLDSANEQYRNAIEMYFSGNEVKAKEQFAKLVTAYNGILTSNMSGTDQNVKDILYFNMGWCSMFLGDFTAAWDNYNKSTMKDIDVGDYYKRELRGRIGLYQFRDIVAKSDKGD